MLTELNLLTRSDVIDHSYYKFPYNANKLLFDLKDLEDIIFVLISIFEVTIIVTKNIYWLFNDVVDSTDYIASNVIMMNCEG